MDWIGSDWIGLNWKGSGERGAGKVYTPRDEDYLSFPFFPSPEMDGGGVMEGWRDLGGGGEGRSSMDVRKESYYY